jgi:hypothetical protein
MKTFYQLIEAVEQSKSEKRNNEDIQLILFQIKDKRDLVKFSLYCAKDCLHLINDEIISLAQKCISLIEAWLNNPKSVTNQQLISAENRALDANNDGDYAWGVYAAGFAVAVIHNDIDEDYYASSCATDAANAFYYISNNDDERVYRQKLNEYRAYALSLLRKTTVDKSKLQVRGAIDDVATLAALLDNLDDQGEDILHHHGKEISLNFPNGMKISANEMGDLVNKIWNNKAALHYLEKLYN